MSSGDTLVTLGATDNHPPSTSYATPDVRGASHPVLDFDAAGTEYGIFHGVLPRNYGGGGLTLTLIWMASSATTGNVIWAAAFQRLNDEGADLDTDTWAADQTAAAAAAPATNGALQYTTIAFTNGAQIDSLAAGEAFRLRVSRAGGNAGDTMAGDAELLAVEIRET